MKRLLAVLVALTVVFGCSTAFAAWGFPVVVQSYYPAYYPVEPVYAYPAPVVAAPVPYVLASPVFAPAPVFYPAPVVVPGRTIIRSTPWRTTVRYRW